ncbi:MAG: hypothetical protein AAF411_01830 [Myxococcota bacterium]
MTRSHLMLFLATIPAFLAGCEQTPASGPVDATTAMDAGTSMDAANVDGPLDARPPVRMDAGPDLREAPDERVCVPDCAGRTCGPDGCGGTCGSCEAGARCIAGVCQSLCPPNSSPAGDECACDRGYAVGPTCNACIADPDLDGCPANAQPQRGQCVCEPGYMSEGCACVPAAAPTCPAGQTLYCDVCVNDPDGNRCPANASPGVDGCDCDEGYRFDESGCACVLETPSFTHPAFESDSCTGPLMTFAEARERYSEDRVLGSYQMVFRQRTCVEDRCSSWERLSLRDIPWATEASGVAQLASIDGEMHVDLDTGVCTHHHYLNHSRYIIGARCSGIGAELACSSYRRPSLCRSYPEDADRYPILDRSLRFYGEIRTDCLQLRADVSRGDVEVQAAVLVSW